MSDAIEKHLESRFSIVDAHLPYDDDFLRKFLELGAFHYFIPLSLGGRCTGASSYMQLVEKTAYYSLPLGLTLGITGSLFLLPMFKHAAPALRSEIATRFLNGPELGGMMITEPTGGTDIFALHTTVEAGNGSMVLNGSKCWGGLTGRAQHWLVAARRKHGDKVSRRLKLLYVPLHSPGVSVTNYFDALGLQPITYGKTQFSNVPVPEAHDLTPEGQSPLRTIYDTLFRSRMGISAIASGLCRRLHDETAERANNRIVFGKPISDYDQVQFRLSSLRGLHQLNRALCLFSTDWMDQHPDMSGDYMIVNAAKLVASETMAIASDSAIQVFASAAYKRNHLIGRAMVDSRPFRIFEGVNDVLDDNTYDAVAAKHEAVTLDTVARELEHYGLALPAGLPPGVSKVLDGTSVTSQRQKVLAGRIIAWITIMAVAEQVAARQGIEIEDAIRAGKRELAARAAELPYL